jgi:hypothetical protein
VALAAPAAGGDGSVMFMPAMFPYPFVMHPQMINGAASQTQGAKVMMMPVMMPPSASDATVPGLMHPGKVDEILGSFELGPDSLPRRRPDIMDLRN